MNSSPSTNQLKNNKIKQAKALDTASVLSLDVQNHQPVHGELILRRLRVLLIDGRVTPGGTSWQGSLGKAASRGKNVDLVVFRENTEDLYAGVEFHPVPERLSEVLGELSRPFSAFRDRKPDEYAISCKINTQQGSERIVRAAFAFAREHKRSKVTVVHKANVVRATDGMFLEAARRVASEYPEITMDDANVDAICMWLLKNPHNYDVLVAPNLYGDIISDLCAQMVGGLGFGCSGNIGEKLAVFEPTHGSAPKYAGQHKVNPIATILAVKMMLDWLGESTMAATLEQATAEVIREGKVRTYDMGGSASTLDVAHAIAARL